MRKNEKHGQTNDRIYKTYWNMMERCYRNADKSYHNYGGRGIAVCDEWKNSFVSFYNWAMENGYSDDLTLDRKDTNGNYSPDNCQWANRTTQNRNRRTRKDNKSGYAGVYKDWNKWRARIKVDGKYINLGSYDDKEDAILARRQAEPIYWK